MLLDTALADVRLLFPADPTRLAATLDRSLRSSGGIEVIAASKTATRCYPPEPLAAELADGIAGWPEYSDSGTPDLVLCGAGDVATGALIGALETIRLRHPGLRMRYVCLHDLLVLNPASERGGRLTPARIAELFPGSGPVVFAVAGYASPVKAMLFDRPELAARSAVLGYADPREVLSQPALLDRTGLSGAELVKYLLDRVAGRQAGQRIESDRLVDYHAEEAS
jgi:phosphoketolase